MMDIIDGMWLQLNLHTGEYQWVVSNGAAEEMFPNAPRFDPEDPNLISY